MVMHIKGEVDIIAFSALPVNEHELIFALLQIKTKQTVLDV